MADQSALDSFELLPADDVLDPADDLGASAASALEQIPAAAAAEPVEPLGRTWLFDYNAGRFVRDGTAPREVRSRQALGVWAGLALKTARGAHAVFSPQFGMDDPDGVIGAAADAQDKANDWQADAIDALLVHDRIASIENVVVEFAVDEGVFYVRSMDIYTDLEGDDPLRFADQTVGTVM